MKNTPKIRFLKTLGLHLLCLAVAFVFIAPLVYLFVSSFKNNSQIVSDMSTIKAFIPYGELSFDNYLTLLEQMNFLKYFRNSSVVAILAVCFGTLINAMMGYSIGMLSFKGKGLLISAIIAMTIIPTESIIINRFMVALNLNILNTIFVLVVPTLAMPMYIFLFYNHFRGMPQELVQAGIVDGCSYIGIFWRIMLPLSKPICATVAIMTFIRSWGDLLWPTMVTRNDTYRTLPQVLKSLFTSDYTYWGQIFAFGVLATIPVLIVFLCFQKQFVQSIAMTGIKG